MPTVHTDNIAGYVGRTLDEFVCCLYFVVGNVKQKTV